MKFSALSVALALACALPAQQATDANSGKLDPVRSLYEKFVAARDQAQEALKPLMAEMRKLERGSPAQQELAKKMNEIRGTSAAPQRAFQEAFAASDWQKFDPSKDAALLKEALPGLCRDLEHPAKALDACKHYLQHFGDERMASMIRSNAMPNALLATGNAEEAAKAYEAAIAEGGPTKARTMLTLGDLRAAQGRIDEAKKLYEEAGSIADEATMNYVTLRKELIGKPAPEIASEHWVGAEASSLAAKKGKVVLVDFWATWCGPCRAVMPALNAMYKENQDKGLEVVGVTRFYPHGYMAADESQMLSGGESVQGMDESGFLEHVTTFKKNTGIAYPFVIGPQSNFTDYHVKGIPTLAVIDRAGNVALITVGSGSEGLLKFAVDQLLAKKQ